MAKKLSLLLGIVFVLMLVVFTGLAIGKYIIFNKDYDPEDQMARNVNVMLSRNENWKKIEGIDDFFSEEDMALIDGSTATIPITAEILRQFFDYTDEEVKSSRHIYHSTTHDAYVNLAESTRYEHEYSKKIIFVTPPSDDELSLQAEYGFSFHQEKLATDGFVFITHKDNPIDSLTVKQIQDIYSGKIKNWKELGGENKEIIAYQREKNSGSQTAMEQLVMGDVKMIDAIKTRRIGFMGGLINAVAEFKNGPTSIGYTYNYYINNLYKNDNIKVLKIDGIEATNENLLNNTYPFSTSYYGIIDSSAPLDSAERKLLEFLVTDKGQELIEMAGYCRRRP